MAKVADVFPAAGVELTAVQRTQLQTADVLLMPNSIIADPKLAPGAKFLYSVLLNHSWKGSVISPSHRELAREIGASVRATRNYVDELTHAKLIALQTRPGKPNLYSIARI